MNGSIDWCCLPRLDSPSVFAGILDPDVGGCFRIAPAGAAKKISQQYVQHTNILQTKTETEQGALELEDWMHMGSFSFSAEDHHRLPAIYRRARCTEGEVTVSVAFNPKLDYARAQTQLTLRDGCVRAESSNDCLHLHSPAAFTLTEHGATAQVRLRAGEACSFICTYGFSEPAGIPSPEQSFEETKTFWMRWVSECEDGQCRILGSWNEEVIRSSLVLKILTQGHGIAAAPTTSLPEILGGADNWDYRFNWIRDTSFTLQALTALGHMHDARKFFDWLCELLVTGGRRPSDLQVLYPLHGMSVREDILSHLRGYRDSKPVRIGNAAALQNQWDIYGEILDTVYRSEYLHPGVDQVLSGVLRDMVYYVCEIWKLPDYGIWEFREEPQHFLYSKVMCWVAIDRGIRLAEHHHWPVDLSTWRRERDALKAMIMDQGYSEKRGAFVQSIGSEALDATALLFPLLEFIPPDHPYALSTLETIKQELAQGVLVYRTERHHGKEGAFGFCGFWLVDALALAGRTDEAREHFEELLKRGNHLGLYAEEIDPKSGEFLGNFPQAFTHVGLINSALYLTRSQTSVPMEQPIMGEKHMPGGELKIDN